MQDFPDPQALRDLLVSQSFIASSAYVTTTAVPKLPDGSHAETSFELWEAYLTNTPESPSEEYKRAAGASRGILHHIDVMANEMRAQLWSQRFYVSADLIAQLLFSSANTADPALGAYETLKANEATTRAALVFPLRSFGIYGAGLARVLDLTISSHDRLHEYAITPQTNDLNATLAFINKSVTQLGITAKASYFDLDHVRRSRGATWLERNPLLVVGLSSASGYYFENEFLQLGRLRTVAGALVMISRFESGTASPEQLVLNSRSINNFQTQDTNHYLMLSKRNLTGKAMQIQAVPVHSRRDVLELTDLNIDFHVEGPSGSRGFVRAVFAAVNTVFDSYVQFNFGATTANDSRAKVFSKWLNAMAYFRRSVRDEGSWESIVGLATAFELLLIDHYAPGTASLLRDRAYVLLRGKENRSALADAVRDAYYARNKTVHSGEMPPADLRLAHKAFVLCFVALTKRINLIPTQGSDTSRVLTGV
ncbi:hypothetical protein BFL34_02177 [Clavibacter michiganensis]|uniref:Uncharacterized protein n=1 Tax=Clavibacter michiganensis TaxID=28447 RepID=A0A251Y7G1_9MICO|nr:HEPN domain-containing protein [Clavibacter michiganensis]OUE20029.1 hypothetical protein BFL34_02177 [Clavibacter michiganensis]